MVVKCSTVCLVALAVLGSFCEAQVFFQKPSTIQKPGPIYHQQEKQTFEKEIEWRFPEDPKIEEKPVGVFEKRQPVSAEGTVRVMCLEQTAAVAVRRDMFGIGQYISAADISLGSCGAMSESGEELNFEVPLHECGSQLSETEEAIIYTFQLNYNPTALGTSNVVRTNQAAVIVQCHYPRKHNVSSLALNPVWVPYASAKISEEFLYFALNVMSADFKLQNTNFEYYLGQTIYIEATVHQFLHVPLRIFVDQCIASNTPDPSSEPNYAIIQNGCFVDARLTGSNSRFNPRTYDNVLQLAIDAFIFQGIEGGKVYITCHLRAALASSPIDETHRACSYVTRWQEANGVDGACGSCEPLGVPIPPTTGAIGTGGGNMGGTGGSTGNTGGFASSIWGIGGGNPGNGGNTGGAIWPSGNTGNPGNTGSQGSNFWGTSTNIPSKTGTRKVREATKTGVYEWQGEVRLGPFEILEKVAD